MRIVADHDPSATTVLDSDPRPSTATVIVLPGSTGRTPSGVPLWITSSALRVVNLVMYASKYGIEKIRSLVRPSRRTSPSPVHATPMSVGSYSVSTHGPVGQK